MERYKYVVKCIRGNNNKFGFGYRHKKDLFVSYEGRTSTLENAYIYTSPTDECALLDFDTEEWKQIP